MPKVISVQNKIRFVFFKLANIRGILLKFLKFVKCEFLNYGQAYSVELWLTDHTDLIAQSSFFDRLHRLSIDR